MTDFNGVKRRTRGQYNVMFPSAAQARRIVVTLGPGDVVVFREEGRRLTYTAPADVLFRFSVRRSGKPDQHKKEEVG